MRLDRLGPIWARVSVSWLLTLRQSCRGEVIGLRYLLDEDT